jgi:hypothetical protein
MNPATFRSTIVTKATNRNIRVKKTSALAAVKRTKAVPVI